MQFRHTAWKFFREHERLLEGLCFFLLLSVIGLSFVNVLFPPNAQAIPIPEEPAAVDISDKTQKKPVQATPEIPSVLPRRLDGMLVAREDANKVPVCVMIENAAFGGVRPQSGLSQASLVYEVVVEGGITRFMAVYAGENSSAIGPVRSARDTYLEFASELNCAYVHAGGSYTAIQAIYSFHLREIEALREYQYFERIATKFAPHNLFTSSEQLYTATENHSWTKENPPSYTMWTFIDPLSEEQRAQLNEDTSVSHIAVDFGGSYDVDYTYNTEKKYFERQNGGATQTDAVTGENLSAKNVIIQHVGDGIPVEGKGRVNWPVTGEGDADIFHDGRVFHARWKKPDRLSRTQYIDADGKDIPFVRGNTWIEIVPPFITTSYE